MSNRNLLILLGMAFLAVYLKTRGEEIKEYFGMIPNRTVIVERNMQTGPQKGDMVEIPGNYQAILSPIGGAGMVDYGAFIRYRTPDNGKLHTADYKNSTPISYASMVTEKFCAPCGSEGYCDHKDMIVNTNAPMKTQNLVPSAFTAGNYAQKFDNLKYNETTDLLPVQSMDNQILNALGSEATQPIIYDRYIYANQKQRTLFGADFLRGDLPIVPIQSDWFRPSAHPSVDLRSGALAVMGGAQNQTSNELLALRSAASGGALDTGSGINFAVQRTPYQGVEGNINVTAFP